MNFILILMFIKAHDYKIFHRKKLTSPEYKNDDSELKDKKIATDSRVFIWSYD